MNKKGRLYVLHPTTNNKPMLWNPRSCLNQFSTNATQAIKRTDHSKQTIIFQTLYNFNRISQTFNFSNLQVIQITFEISKVYTIRLQRYWDKKYTLSGSKILGQKVYTIRLHRYWDKKYTLSGCKDIGTKQFKLNDGSGFYLISITGCGFLGLGWNSSTWRGVISA